MNEEKSFLVTTPLEDSFCQDYKGKIVYLGNKNLDLLKKLNISSKGITKINSRWHNKNNLIEDHHYLEDLEERFFNSFFKSMNITLGVSHSKKYWDIFVRRNVYGAICFLFEKWQTINYVFNNFEISETHILNVKNFVLPYKDDRELVRNIFDSDLFNHVIYSDVIRAIRKVKYNEIEIDNLAYTKNKIYFKKRNNFNFHIFKKINIKSLKILFYIIQKYLVDLWYLIAYKKNYFIFISPYVNTKTNFIIRKKYRQPNIKFDFKEKNFDLSYSTLLRKQLFSNLKFEPLNPFENFLKRKIIEILPLSYLEGYHEIVKANIKNRKKINPKVLFVTADEIIHNKNLKYIEWLSYNRSKGSKIFCIQNGGSYFTPKVYTCETFVRKNISDTFFHCGREDINDKITGVGFERIFYHKKVKSNPEGNIILALYPGVAYDYFQCTTKPMQDDWNDYIEDKINFLNYLPNKIKEKVLVRLKKRHHEAVQFLWNKLFSKGYIYLSNYKGWYSVSDEAYYNEDEIVEKDGKKISVLSGSSVEWVEEESYFFKLSSFQDELLNFYIKNPNFILPTSRKNEGI